MTLEQRHHHHREEAHVDFGRAQVRALHGDGQVTREHQPQATRQRVPIDARHGGLAQFLEARQQPPIGTATLVRGQEALVTGQGSQVPARAEDLLTGARQHHHAHRGVGFGPLQRGHQLAHHPRGQGVAGLGPVNGQERLGALDFVADFSGFHSDTSAAWAPVRTP